MPNPGGTNQFQGFAEEAPYGDLGRQARQMKDAPLAGAQQATTALQTPRRAQKRATRPQRQGAPQQVPPQGMPEQQVSPQFTTAQQWQQLLQVPGLSPLGQQMAARAAAQNG